MEHGPFIDGLPIRNGDFHGYVKYQMVPLALGKTYIRVMYMVNR